MRCTSFADRTRAAVVVGALLAVPGVASGQTTSTAVDVQNFWPGAGPSEAIALRSSDIDPHRAIGFGLVANYAHRPLRLTDRISGNAVDGVGGALTTDFLFSLGLFDRVQLEFAAPLVVEETGFGASAFGGNPTNLGVTALRDLRFDVAISIFKRARRVRSNGFGLRVDLGASVPTGDRNAFEGGNTASFIPTVVADHRIAGVTFTANAGARVRGAAFAATYAQASQATLGIGVSYRPSFFDRLLVGVDYVALPSFAGTLDVQSAQGTTRTLATQTPMELFVGAHCAIDRGRDLEVSFGGGIPLDSVATVPSWRLLAGVVYAPRGNDDDGDGVLDGDDRCPTVPEDHDGFEDTDGCPDPDNDHDHIPDVQDRCPNEAEDVDNFQDDDGCPDPDNDQDGVPDTDDVCATVPEGPNPDLDRPGCPRPDRDRDEVLDDADRCPDEAAGPHPDPARPGCPILDRDHDGVADGDDACPNDPPGDHPDSFRLGCRDDDRDHDGVVNETDRCPDEPETINGVTDDDGCPDEGDAHTSLGRANLTFTPPMRLSLRARSLTAAQLHALLEAAQRLRGVRYGLTGVSVEVTAASARENDVAAATRLATLVHDALATSAIPPDRITATGVAAATSTGDAINPAAPAPAAPTRAGDVRIRLTRAAPVVH